MLERYKKIKFFLKFTPVYWCLLLYRVIANKAKEKFRKINPAPSSNLFKQEVVKSYFYKYKIGIFIETGTFLGEMVEAVKDNFKKIYSIELDKRLYKKSKRRFGNNKHIHILLGDSGEILPKILASLREPCIFWLDAHYSGGVTGKGVKNTPILKELNYILDNFIKGSVILIDDARLFIKIVKDYPSIDELKSIIINKRSELKLEVKDDIIRIF
ncbi:hypothetical protein K8R32_04590 [bacterium]|nr:hypothetical protein [bacterium]